MINVIKRTGVKEKLQFGKIRKHTDRSCRGLLGTSSSELEEDTKIQLRDGIHTEEIQNLLIKTASEKIDIDRPNWTYVAARLTISDIYAKVALVAGGTDLKSTLTKCLEEGRLQHGLISKYDIDELNEYIDVTRDLQFTYLGIKTLYDRYIIKDSDNNPIETPQTLFMAVAMYLAQNEEDCNLWAKKFYDILSKFEVMAATPTLSNARKPRGQCSSCYIGSTPDSAEGITASFKEMILLSKFGGGIGWDWNTIRPARSYIDGHKGVSGGIIPMLKIVNDISIAFDQLGTRKGAIAVYIEPWHMDIMDFMDLKKNSGEERRRAHELFPALWFNDLLLERAEKDLEWTLFDSSENEDLAMLHGDEFKKRYEELERDPNVRKEVISAKNLWKTILRSYFETGNPFIAFKDEAHRRNPNRHAGVIRSSNLCTEIFQNTEPSQELVRVYFYSGETVSYQPDEPIKTDENRICKPYDLTSNDSINGSRVYSVEKHLVDGQTAVCNLASVNLSKVNTKEDFERVIPIAMRMLDNVIDLNFFPVKKVKDTNTLTRAVGLGVMGEAQMLAENKVLFGTKEHFELINKTMDSFSFNVIKSSVTLAKEKGPYPLFAGSDWSKGILPIDSANENVLYLTNNDSENDWEGLRNDVRLSGVRNGYMMAIAPTSSISILVGTTQAIEPVYKRKWFEENLSGLIPVTAPNINSETWNFYITAYEVNQLSLIKAGAVRQKWIDQGQSLNIFVNPKNTTGKTLDGIFRLANKLGIKSTYYLRSMSPEEESSVIDRSIECMGCQ